MKYYEQYIEILEKELVPAMGCTEPIAIAYCASKVKETLGALPNKVDIIVSGNIIKNVKSVVVPHTNKKHGIEVAAAIGIVAGDPSKELEVLSNVKDEEINEMSRYLEKTQISVQSIENDHTLYIEIQGYYQDKKAKVIIQDAHTHIYSIELNDKIIYLNSKDFIKKKEKIIDKNILNIKGIIDFANKVKIEDIRSIIERQIKYNMAISLEGIKNDYGARIGKTILNHANDDIVQICKAYAASGSDARMNGCDLPVIINSGSGNQGLTCSVPVIVYAQNKSISEEKLYRALIVSNLITIHIKNSIGKLSAFCGVVIAGAASGAGIAYLDGGQEKEVSHTLVNSLAIVSGIVCDGAKSSCAAKIASSVEAGILGYYMYLDGNEFIGGDGIVKKGVENTIKAVGQLARVGMMETDKEIIHIMVDNKICD